jgi:hypothetical protein
MRTTQVLAVVFLCAICATIAPAQTTTPQTSTPIDRHALVTRHNIEVHAIDPNGAMAVGNGEFAFNFDVTGLQSFPEYYAKTMPIGILSDLGLAQLSQPQRLHPGQVQDGRRSRSTAASSSFPTPAPAIPPPDAAYLRGNPHRFGLGRIGLEMTHADGSKVVITDLANIDERLDIWDGILTSSFIGRWRSRPRGPPSPLPDRDEVAVRIESPLIAAGRLKVRIAFPYASHSFGPDYQDWDHPSAHSTTAHRARGTSSADSLCRTLDATQYSAARSVVARRDAG